MDPHFLVVSVIFMALKLSGVLPNFNFEKANFFINSIKFS